MGTIANIAVGVVAAMHVNFMMLEMLFWTKPYGRKAFGLTPEFAKSTAAYAANQGLYNGFLVAGLIWGLIRGDAGFDLKVFFLACVVIAGIFGAVTANRKILFAQAIPGAIALALVLLAR